jgi:hypothetical protein
VQWVDHSKKHNDVIEVIMETFSGKKRLYEIFIRAFLNAVI